MSLLTDITHVKWDNDYLDIHYKNSTDIGMAINNIIDRTVYNTDFNNLTSTSDNSILYENLEKELNNSENFNDVQIIKKFATELSDIYKNAFITLKTTVTDKVENLAQEIRTIASERMGKAISYYELDGELKPVIPEYETFSVTDDLNIQDIAISLKEKYNLKATNLNTNNLKFLLESINLEHDISLSDNVKYKLINQFISDKYKEYDTYSDEDKKHIRRQLMEILNTVISKNSFHAFKKHLFGSNVYQNKLDATAVRMAFSFINMYPSFEYFTKFDLELAEPTLIKLNDNLIKLSDMHKCCGILLELAKYKYDDVLVLDHTLLNAKELKTFEELGGTITDIYDHIRYFHNTNTEDIIYSYVHHLDIPINGIKANTIIEHKSRVKTKLAKYKDETKHKLKDIKTSTMVSAIETQLRKYIHNTINNTENIDKNRMLATYNTELNQVMTSMYRSPNGNVEDHLYSFILNTEYKNNLVSTIYNRFNVELINSLESHNTITDVDIATLEATTMSDILCAYLTNTFIDK